MTGLCTAEAGFTVDIVEQPDDLMHRALLAPLKSYSESRAGTLAPEALAVALRDERGEVVGGAWGGMVWGWLYTEMLVVPDGRRGRGLGTALMRTLEQEAVRRGCHSAWVDTFDFQAPAFYEKLGYSCFGRLDDFPIGSTRYFLRRTLVAPCPPASRRREAEAA
ncbi:MAG TPA: GNAT family N-acetyltransferase [Albitalea sp.]|uniref:GNAT family N-acetyltransferase n=1 Tax=Piscinibacter sp. TaxID=1903157 RepID=UPI002ED6C0C6